MTEARPIQSNYSFSIDRERSWKRVIISIILLSVLLQGFSQLKVYDANRLNGETPNIDGVISEEVWQLTEWEGDFIQREPYENKPPSQNTAFKILYDDNNLYVAIRAFDSVPGKIEKRLTRRDHFEGDMVGISIDSYNDKLTGYSFIVNAAGVKNDETITNDDEYDETWDPVWYVKVSIDELGWVAEMKIPYTQLRFAKVKDHTWGLQVSRFLFRKEELSLWQPVPQDASGWVSMWGELQGINNIDPKKEVELVPYAMGKYTTDAREEGNPFATGQEWGYNAGLDGKVAVTNDLTLNFTVNPDFGQVEADPSEVNLSAFESFFEEKRPFFIEGNNIYNYQIIQNGGYRNDNLFYSRRIGRSPHYYPDLADGEYASVPEFTRILGAVKLSGKTSKGLSIGVLESVTNSEKAIIESNDERRTEIVEPITNYFNARLQQDFQKGKTIVGGMFTATNRFFSDSTLNFLPTAAYTGGLDFTNHWKDKDYYFRAKAVFSLVQGSREAITKMQESPQRYFQRPDAGHLSVDPNKESLFGNGGTLEGGKIGGGHWRFGGWLTWRTPGLDLNDMGFLRQSDVIQQVVWGGYRIWEPFSIFRSLNLNASQWSGWDFSGLNISTGYEFNINLQFKNYWSFGTGVNRQGSSINRHELRGGPSIMEPGSWGNWMFVNTDERKKLVFEVFMFNRWGDENYSRAFNIGTEISYRPLDFLQISLEPGYSSSREAIIYVETLDYNGQPRYIVSRIDQQMASADFRINISITPDLSIQYWGQPFVFSGDYSEYKRVLNNTSAEYRDQYHQFTENEIFYDKINNVYNIDENGNGQTDYSFSNPDFSFFEFRSNLVIRWEYIPGSTAYLVWSQGRTGNRSEGVFDMQDHVDRLSTITPRNIFLVKFSYRFSF